MMQMEHDQKYKVASVMFEYPEAYASIVLAVVQI